MVINTPTVCEINYINKKRKISAYKAGSINHDVLGVLFSESVSGCIEHEDYTHGG